MHFLTLTLLNDERIRINFDHVESYIQITEDNYKFDHYSKDFIGCTSVLPAAVEEGCPNYVVKESPDRIDNMLYCLMERPVNAIY